MSIIKVPSKKAKKGYTYKVTFKYKENDITRTYSKSGFIVKKEAQEHESMVKAQINQDGYLKKICNDSLNKVFDDWLKVDSRLYFPNTIANYKIYYNRYVYSSEIGKKKIINLHYKDIQNLLNDIEVSYDVCKSIKKVLNCVFKFAIKNEYIENNPVQYTKITKEKEKKNINQYLKHDDFIMLTSKLDKGTFRQKAISIAIKIGYYTGLRISEILALNKSDVDFINNKIIVNKQILYKGKKQKDIEIKKTKTIASNGNIPLVDMLKNDLLKWFNINMFDKVVCNSKGEYLNSINAQQSTKTIAKSLGIEDFHFHMLRHTFITNLHAKNVDVKATQELARHSDINTTLNVYTHLEENDKKDTLNRVFEQIYSKNTPKTGNQNIIS